MSELLEAAKAVLEGWTTGDYSVFEIEELRAAVDRAEKQEAVRLSDDEIFDIENNLPDEYIGDIKYTLGFARAIEQRTWLAAQQALRDQIKEMLRQSDEWFEEDQQAQAKWLLEKIDDSTL